MNFISVRNNKTNSETSHTERNKRINEIASCGELSAGVNEYSEEKNNININECKENKFISPFISFEGTVNGKEGKIMIDSGSSSNFISSEFVKANRLGTFRLEQVQVVQLADGSEYRVTHGVKVYVRWKGWSGKVYLLGLPLKKYDIILGMSWLRKHNPNIDWTTGECKVETKILELEQKFNNQNEYEMNVIRNQKHNLSALAIGNISGRQSCRGVLNLLSAKQWRQEIKNGGEGGIIIAKDIRTVANNRELQLNNLEIKSIKEQNPRLNAILKEYADVFPEDLPVGLPKQRAIDHRINLLPGSTPPARPAYRMSPKDSLELKKQLDDLIAHGYCTFHLCFWRSSIIR